MQAARGAVKEMREKGKSFVKPKYADHLLGSGLEEQIRRATAKTLPGPDLALNRRIVETINTELNQYSAQQLSNVLKGRLTLKNAHKQWLALELVQEVLERCSKVIEPARSDLLEEVANIAAQPMNRYGSDLPGQQHCKNASFALLKKYGGEGQDAMREAVGLGSVTRFDKDDAPDFSRFGQGRNEPHSSKYNAYDSRPDMHSSRDSHRQSDNTDSGFSAVRERVQMGIATSHSHTEALQDMVLNLSEDSSRRDAESDKGVLKDLVKEMLAFRNKFEGTLEALSQYETRESQVLMTEALEAMDMMNNAIILQNEVLTARKNKHQDSFGRSSSSNSTGARGSTPRLAPPPGSGVTAPAAHQQQQQQAALSAPGPPQQPSYLDAFTELQQAMDTVHMSSGPPTPQQGDPFATNYMHPSSQSSHPLPSSDPFSQPSSAHSPYGQPPSSEQASNAQGSSGQSSFGQSSFGQPSDSQLSFGHPVAGQPLSEQPYFGQSSQGQGSSGQPPFGQSSYGQPSYGQPPSGQSSFGQSQYGQAPQMSQQQAASQGAGATHNPFAAAGGFGGGSSFGNAGMSSGAYPALPNQHAPPTSSSYQPPNYSSLQHTGAPSQPEQTDPFDQLPYPSLGLTRPTKPQRAPAPPLASLATNKQQPPVQQGLLRMQSTPPLQQAQQAQQGQSSSNVMGGSVWNQPEANQNEPAAASFEFGESAFSAPQASTPQQSEDRPTGDAPRPKQLYINSLYNAEDGAGDDQLPPGFDPSQQGLSRGTGSWGMQSPASSPSKGGGYMGGSGPPTPEGLQYQHSAGSSQATTPAQNTGNTEWDMFFANRVQQNGSGSAPPQQQQPTTSMTDAFDELIHTRSR